MTHPRLYIEPEQLDANSDLQTVLQAWHGATLRLEQTHEALRQEVCRLTDELEAKNRELAAKTVWPIWGKWPRTSPMRFGIAWCPSRCI